MAPQSKQWLNRLFIPAVIVLVGVAAFGLGRLSVLSSALCQREAPLPADVPAPVTP